MIEAIILTFVMGYAIFITTILYVVAMSLKSIAISLEYISDKSTKE